MVNNTRRRQIIVNPELQRRIIFATAWAPCIAFAVTSALLAIFCVRVYHEAVESDADVPSLVPLFAIAIVFTAASGAWTVWSARRLSNRIAGPMHNISKTLSRYRAGAADARVQLRNGDFLCDLQDDINDLLEWLADRGETGEAPATEDAASGQEAAVSN